MRGEGRTSGRISSHAARAGTRTRSRGWGTLVCGTCGLCVALVGAACVWRVWVVGGTCGLCVALVRGICGLCVSLVCVACLAERLLSNELGAAVVLQGGREDLGGGGGLAVHEHEERRRRVEPVLVGLVDDFCEPVVRHQGDRGVLLEQQPAHIRPEEKVERSDQMSVIKVILASFSSNSLHS